MPDAPARPDDLDSPPTVAAILGSFWAYTYGGLEQVLAYCGATGALAGQIRSDLAEAAACLARRTVPVLHRERWRVASLRRSEAHAAPVAFGSAGALGGGAAFGDRATAASWPCPAADVSLIFNRISAPSRTLVRGIDFAIAGGRLAFRVDPFSDPLLAARDVVDDSGAVVDREVTVWLFGAGDDREHIYTHHGYALGLRMPSSAAYRDVVNAVFDCLVDGSSDLRLRTLLATLAGAPMARSDGTVRHVLTDARGTVIVTDDAAYRCAPGSTPAVAAGDQVRAGDFLSDALRLDDLRSGVVPAGLAALAIGEGVLAPGYYGDIVFADREVPLEVDSGPGRFTRVRWELGGHPQDVDLFWDDVHRRGVARGQTLAHLLDVRDDPSDEPGPASLPATVNPLRFLVGNLLRGGCLVLRVRAAAVDRAAPGLAYLHLARAVMPPHVALLVLIELPPFDDSATMSMVDDAPDAADSPPAIDDSVTAAATWDGPVTVRNVSDTCQ
jgi:hypothetical protein